MVPHHHGVRQLQRHDGSWGKHKLWVTLADSTRSTMVMGLPASWEEDILFLKAKVSWPLLLLEIVHVERSQGKIRGSSVPPCVQLGTNMNYTKSMQKVRVKISSQKSTGQAWEELTYSAHCCQARRDLHAFSPMDPWMLPPERLCWASSWDKPV